MGNYNLVAGGDGLKSDNAEDVTRGYISVDTGAIHIAAGGDGFDARTDVIIKSGQISLASGGGSSNNVVSGALG